MKKFTLALTACCLAALLLTGCLSLGYLPVWLP